MTEIEIIDKVLKANSPVEVFDDLNDWKKTYREYSKIHPDVCKEPKANDAFAKLNTFKTALETGIKYKDDAGVVSYSLNKVEFIGDETLLKKSFGNYQLLMSLKDDASQHFKKYLPTVGTLLSPNELSFTIPQRAVPLSSLGTVEQKHANWILSRMLEFVGWINQCE